MSLFNGLYSDYATARRLAQTYEDERVVARLVEAQSRLQWDGVLSPLSQQSTAALLAGLLRDGTFDGHLRVCDFGGGLGGARTALAAILGNAVALDWDVVETPALARAGNQRFAGPGLRFHDTLDALAGREFDAVLVSGVLQYLPDPEESFARLAGLPHRHLVMNRFPVRHAVAGLAADLCTIQDLGLLQPGVTVPHWCFSQERWLELIGATHETVMRWTDDFDGRHPLDDGSEVSFIGLLLSRSTSGTGTPPS